MANTKKPITVVYEGDAKAILDPKAMEKRDAKRAKDKLPVTRKKLYRPGTIFFGIQFPTGKEVEVSVAKAIDAIKAHVKNKETDESEGSPFKVI